MNMKKNGIYSPLFKRIIQVDLYSRLLQYHIPRVKVGEMDGDTLLNNRNPPPHTMKGIVGKLLVGENYALGLLPVYYFWLLA